MAYDCADVLLFYDKQGGPRSEDTTTMRFADAIGATPYSYSKVIIIGLYSKYSASVARKSSAWQIGQLHDTHAPASVEGCALRKKSS